jgi:hypothetical protein
MLDNKSVSFPVKRPLTAYEMDDVRQAIENIMDAQSFFYAGDGELGDEIRAFLIDHPITSNLEFEEDGS